MTERKLKYWRYKAYTSDYRLYEGVLAASNFEAMALALRQRGYSVVEATTISASEYKLAKKIEGGQLSAPLFIIKKRSMLRRFISYLGSWVRRKKPDPPSPQPQEQQ